jgi:PhnB protein
MTDGNAVSPAPDDKALAYLRPGTPAVIQYIVVRPAAQFIEFLKSAFGATEKLRIPSPDGTVMHAEVEIGNGMVELSDGNVQYQTAPCAVHLYVANADETYGLAIKAGATSIYPVADQPWGDRQGAVKDPFGNIWYIAKANWDPGPNQIPSVQPFLHLRNANAMLPFLESAFEAQSLGVAKSDDDKILHATIQIGNATLEIDEAQAEFQPMPCHLHVYVPDTDAAYARAMKAGATSLEAPQDKDYGERSAGVKDAWGNSWFIATPLFK